MAKSKTMPTPTAQMLRFVDEYCVDFNGAKAAERAGYAKGASARAKASALLARDDIAELVAAKQKKMSASTGITAENVLREVGRMVFADLRKAFNENGSLKSVHEMDDDTAAAIASIEVEELFSGAGKDRAQIGYTTKVKLFDKNSAAEKLMRHLGMFEKDNRQKVDPLAELLALIQSRNTRLPIKH